jgi:hypothetical protein
MACWMGEALAPAGAVRVSKVCLGQRGERGLSGPAARVEALAQRQRVVGVGAVASRSATNGAAVTGKCDGPSPWMMRRVLRLTSREWVCILQQPHAGRARAPLAMRQAPLQDPRPSIRVVGGVRNPS